MVYADLNVQNVWLGAKESAGIYSQVVLLLQSLHQLANVAAYLLNKR